MTLLLSWRGLEVPFEADFQPGEHATGWKSGWEIVPDLDKARVEDVEEFTEVWEGHGIVSVAWKIAHDPPLMLALERACQDRAEADREDWIAESEDRDPTEPMGLPEER